MTTSARLLDQQRKSEPQNPAHSSPSSETAAVTRLTHLNMAGEVHMVDISQKKATSRRATAVSTLSFSSPATYTTLMSAQTKKGDALAVTRIAAIQAVKQTATLIPLSHPGLGITGVTVDVTPFAGTSGAAETSSSSGAADDHKSDNGGVTISATVSCHGRTGIEMEALTGATVGALTMYDMLKGIDKNMVIGGARVVEKIGGKSGTWRWDQKEGRLVNVLGTEDAVAKSSHHDSKETTISEREGHGDVDEWNNGLADEFSVSALDGDRSDNLHSETDRKGKE